MSLSASADIEVLRSASVPYIPGSSIKGAMRSYAERLLASQGDKTHDPWDKQRINEEKQSGFCTICKIFGNTELASHVQFFDAYPINPDNVPVEVKSSVGIDRLTKAKKPGVLFDEEFVSPGVAWDFRLRVFNIDLLDDSQEARLLKSLLSALREGFVQLGGRKSTGAGLVKLEDAEVKKYVVRDYKLTMEWEKKIDEILRGG